MNDKDLRALAAKLLKHYVIKDEAVAKIVETKTPERGDPKVVPLITADERALLNMLGGHMAGTMESRVISLAAQGCGCGCGCGCGDGDDDGESSADADAAASAAAAAAATGATGDLGDAAAAAAADAAAAATGVAGDLGAAADAAASASAAAAAAGATGASAGETGGTGLSAGEAAGWGGLGAGLGSQGAEGLAGLADGPDGPDGPESGMVGLTNDSLTQLSPAELASIMSAPQADPGISNATYGALASQNADLSNTLNAVNAGLDANAAAQSSAGTLGDLGSLGIGSALGELFGISSAKAEPSLTLPVQGNPRAVGSAAEQWAAQGKLASFLAANPDYAKTINNSFWDNLNGSYMSQLQAKNDAALAAQGQQAIYGSQEGRSLDPSATPFGSLGTSSVAATAPSASPLAPDIAPQIVSTTPVTGQLGSYAGASSTSGPASTLGDLEDEHVSVLSDADRAALAQAQWTASGRSGSPTDFQDSKQGLSMNTLDALAAQNAQAAQTLSNTAAGLPGSTPTAAPAAPAAPSAPSQVAAAPSLAPAPAPEAPQPSYTGIPAIDSKIANAINNPGQTAINLGVGLVPGVGIANTLSGLLGGPTVGSLLTGGSFTGAEPGSMPDAGSGGGGDSGGGQFVPPITATAIPTVGSGSSLPSAVSPVESQEAILRRYLGASSDPYRYGMGPERTYYSAEGGYFDADQYFADGGLVSPLQPPSQPTVPPYPTMAFTDGGGPVGSIAQPPGLVASDAYGSDAPHASPMAPSVAAAIPTTHPGLATLAMRNVNASPASSPIAQNPNVGYALGQSPLSNL